MVRAGQDMIRKFNYDTKRKIEPKHGSITVVSSSVSASSVSASSVSVCKARPAARTRGWRAPPSVGYVTPQQDKTDRLSKDRT